MGTNAYIIIELCRLNSTSQAIRHTQTFMDSDAHQLENVINGVGWRFRFPAPLKSRHPGRSKRFYLPFFQHSFFVNWSLPNIKSSALISSNKLFQKIFHSNQHISYCKTNNTKHGINLWACFFSIRSVAEQIGQLHRPQWTTEFSCHLILQHPSNQWPNPDWHRLNCHPSDSTLPLHPFTSLLPFSFKVIQNIRSSSTDYNVKRVNITPSCRIAGRRIVGGELGRWGEA